MPNPTFLALHVPNGFLSDPVAIFGCVLAAILLSVAALRVRDEISPQRVPLIGVVAALIFAAQMLNFPILNGTSGHLVGAMLVAVLLGPWAASLTISSVLVVQALVFHDGGVLALGFNIVNMGIISVFVGYGLYRLAVRALGDNRRGLLLGAALGAWAGVVVSAAATAVELAVSGTTSFNLALPAMVGIHAFIGIGEALITVGALLLIRQPSAAPARQWVVAVLLIACALTLVAPLASSEPDGLERVAIDHGFDGLAEEPSYLLLPDYNVPFIAQPALTTIVAGIIGVLVTSAAGFALAYALRRTK